MASTADAQGEVVSGDSMNENFYVAREDNEAEALTAWLRNSLARETINEEAVSTWLVESGLTEGFEAEASWQDWVGNIGQGIASGAVTGLAGGPYGALIGGLIGGGLGALQTATQPDRSRPTPPPPQPPPAASMPNQPRPTPPSPPPAAAPMSAANLSGLSPQLIQQLVALLPLLMQLLTQQTGPHRQGETAESSDIKDDGDFVSSDTQFSGERAQTENERGIDVPSFEAVKSSTNDNPVFEYPFASRFVPAAEGNFREVSISPGSGTGLPSPFYWRKINRIVIHITDGGPNINGTISWFQDPAAGVSAHYIVGQDGEIVQMVRHKDIAYHARAANTDSIGIEHIARAPGSFRSPPDRSEALYPTQVQYCASAALVRWLCDQYHIPIDRQHIQGHSEADSRTTHLACPNSVWNWDYYMSMVLSASCLPFPPRISEGVETRVESEPSSMMDASNPLATQATLAPPAIGWGEEFGGSAGVEIATESVFTPIFAWAR